jgi:murein DD-endopeptidase MepM/ murein hydrolase activator NlpD
MKPILALSLCLLLAAPALPQQQRKQTGKKVSLSSRLHNVRSRQAHVQKELRKAKVQTKWVVQDIDKVDKRITVVTDQLEDTTRDLNTNKVAQKKIANKLIDTNHRLAETREQLRRRLKAIYYEGDSGYMTVLAGTQSFGELAARSDMLQTIAEQDRRLFDRYAQLRVEVATRKKQQDKVVREIGRLANFHKTKQTELKEVRNDKHAALQSLASKQNQLRAMLAQFQADERSIESQIAAYMRRLAAERRNRMIAKRVKRGKRYVTVHVPAPAVIFNGRFSAPVHGRMTSRFGMRHHPILGINRLHAGVDFGGGYGAPIYAAATGTVIASSYMRGYGNCVIIDHGSGITTTYGHCSRVFVRSGQSVSRGQRIGSIGASGLATGPHLHFEVRVNGRPVNPLGRL